jgi:MFS family permease
VLLALCRFGQGLGLGGEWGGAVLLATENAPPGKRCWYGMFPQLGAPVGFLCSSGIFLLLTDRLSDSEFFAYGWRIGLPRFCHVIERFRDPLARIQCREVTVSRGADEESDT